MDDNRRLFFTVDEIEALDMEELDRIAGGAVNKEVKCPVCKKFYPIREIKSHIQTAHGGQ